MKFKTNLLLFLYDGISLGSSVVTEMFRIFEICVPCEFELSLCCYMQDRIAHYFLNLLYLFFLIKMTIIPHTYIFHILAAYPNLNFLRMLLMNTSLIFPHLLTNFLKCLFSYKYLSNLYNLIDLCYSYRIGHIAIVRKVCKAIWFYFKKKNVFLYLSKRNS